MSIYDHKTLRTSTLLDEAPELDVNFLIGLQEYNLSLDDLDSLDESVLAETVADMIPGSKTAQDVKTHIDNIKDLKNQWKKVSDKFTMHKWIYRYIKDDKQEAM